MDFDRLNRDIKEMRRRNRGLGIAVGVLAAGHVLGLTVILNLVGSVRTLVVPPSINKASGSAATRRAASTSNRWAASSPGWCWT